MCERTLPEAAGDLSFLDKAPLWVLIGAMRLLDATVWPVVPRRRRRTATPEAVGSFIFLALAARLTRRSSERPAGGAVPVRPTPILARRTSLSLF